MNAKILYIGVLLLIVVVGIFVYFEFLGHHTVTPTHTQVPLNETFSGPLTIYVADAYTQEASFLLNASGIPGVVKGGGSYSLAREISQGVPVSVFMPVASSAAQENFLGEQYPGWVIAFVEDQLVIAYSNATLKNPTAMNIVTLFSQALKTNSSKLYYYAFSNLTSGKVKIGISDPASDPAGGRALVAFEIAGYLYANHSTNYFINNMIKNQANVTASNAAELVSPLESGDIQFLFIYKSAAIAKGLNYITLPAWINQGDQQYSSFYSQFYYTVGVNKIYGAPIYLYVTIPKYPLDYEEALNFTVFVIEHASLLSKFGLTPLSHPILFVYNSSEVPGEINNLVQEGVLTEQPA